MTEPQRHELLRAWLCVPIVVGTLILMAVFLPRSVQQLFVGWGAPALLVIFALFVDRFVFGKRPR